MLKSCRYLLSEDHQIILEKLIMWCRNQSTGLDYNSFRLFISSEVHLMTKILILSAQRTFTVFTLVDN